MSTERFETGTDAVSSGEFLAAFEDDGARQALLGYLATEELSDGDVAQRRVAELADTLIALAADERAAVAPDVGSGVVSPPKQALLISDTNKVAPNGDSTQPVASEAIVLSSSPVRVSRPVPRPPSSAQPKSVSPVSSRPSSTPAERIPYEGPPDDDEDGEAVVLAWQARALCAQTDPEIFFPDKGEANKDAKRICRNCEVRAECLEYALDNDEQFGVWGGLSERERRRLKREAT